jgi:hypothetical protein
VFSKLLSAWWLDVGAGVVAQAGSSGAQKVPSASGGSMCLVTQEAVEVEGTPSYEHWARQPSWSLGEVKLRQGLEWHTGD